MALPPQEQIRNRQERQFQARVLGALERPKQNRVLAIINSRFFLWLMTAILLTVGGGYITNVQQCMRDADQIIDRRDRLSAELDGRKFDFHLRVERADTLLETLIFPDTRGSRFSDLSKLSFMEIEQELRKLTSRVEYDPLNDPDIEKARLAWATFTSDELDKLLDEFNKPLPAGDDDALPSTPGEQQRTLELRKLSGQLQLERDEFERALEAYAYLVQPDCGVGKLLMSALGYRPKIVRASLSPALANGTFGSIITDRIERIAKLQAEIRQRRQ